jgi:hypothetical protein
MRMLSFGRCARLFAAVGAIAAALTLSGCPSPNEKPSPQPPSTKSVDERRPAAPATETAKQAAAGAKTAAKPQTPEKDLSQELERVAEKPRDLGPPLVPNRNQLVRLDPDQPVWVDRPNQQVVLQGEVCRAGYPLEFFATYSNRSYESVTSVNVKPSIVHAGLLAVGAKPGHPARFQPDFAPPTGTEVAIEVRWVGPEGKIEVAPAQHWIRNIKTKKELDSNWVFAGSGFVTDEATGKEYYQADSGELICVLSLPNAMLDLPSRGYGALEARSFEAFEEHLPPPGTSVTIVLKPILAGQPASEAKPPATQTAADNAHAVEEKKALDAAEPWLALIDQGEYAQGYETAAEYLKGAVDRKDFIRSVSTARKPFGKVQSRKLESKQYATSLPGAPAGRYVVMQYKTQFANGKSAIETITPTLDRDKKWRVSGYYIK